MKTASDWISSCSKEQMKIFEKWFKLADSGFLLLFLSFFHINTSPICQFFAVSLFMEFLFENALEENNFLIRHLLVLLCVCYLHCKCQVWREKNVLKPTPGKKRCTCRNEVSHRQIGPRMFQQMKEQVCDKCPNVKYEREGYFITVDIEKACKMGW